jgi:hypothetical protein
MRITARWLAWVGGVAALSLLSAIDTSAQVKAQVPPAAKPAWGQGIQPISRESYYSAIECGKQGGTNPPCLFYDAGLCKNDEFTLAMYTPYKMVAYTVWQAVQQKREPPNPSYPEAQKLRVVLGVKPLHAQNPLAGLIIKRGGRAVKAASQTLDAGGGTFIFDFATFAPTSGIAIEMTGKTKTVTCQVDAAVLARFR